MDIIYCFNNALIWLTVLLIMKKIILCGASSQALNDIDINTNKVDFR
jgi:hypothetical protein